MAGETNEGNYNKEEKKRDKKRRKENQLNGEKCSTVFDFYSFRIVYWI